MKTLITPAEVVRYSDIDLNTPVCNFRQIEQIEAYIFGTKLSSQLYSDMLDMLNDYSGAQTWKSTDTIAKDDLRVYNGQVYKALKASTNILPTNIENWAGAKKFVSDCFESFWCDVLANYLALSVVENRLPKMWIKVKADGVVKQRGEMYDPASNNDYRTYHNSVIRDLEINYFNLMQYIRKTPCLNQYSFCGAIKSEDRVQYNVG